MEKGTEATTPVTKTWAMEERLTSYPVEERQTIWQKRFLPKVTLQPTPKSTDPCLIWTGYKKTRVSKKTPLQYGVIVMDEVSMRSSRVAYVLYTGAPIPP